MAPVDTDRNLLFGLLALQNGLIDQAKLVAAFQAWTIEKVRPLAEHLVARGDLDADDRSAVEALVTRHLKKHGGSTEKSLAAIPAGPSTRRSLQRIADPEIHASLAVLGPETDGDGVLARIAERTGALTCVILAPTDPGPEPPVVGDGDGLIDESAGRYQVLGEIARGGMGAVLRGRDPDLGRDLALKVLLDQHRGRSDLIDRFVEEAQICGQLQHPGVVPVYELGTLADHRPYFTMKLVKGQTLAALLAERLSPTADLPRLLAIFEAVCQTVAYAHARGVIHRDLKPSNVMVGSFGEVQVMDWGLAKVLPKGGQPAREPAATRANETIVATARSKGDSELSQVGSVLGTPAYMAPEQSRGETEAIDRRADVFALGSILCEILTGLPAFRGSTAIEILRTAGRADTAAALDGLARSGADDELLTLARDCLAAEAKDRPVDAGVVARRLTAYLAGVQERLHEAELSRAAESARALEAEAKVSAERQARRLTIALAATVLVAGVMGGAGWRWVELQRLERVRGANGRVNVALQKATRLRGLAQGAALGDLGPWELAAVAAEKARDLLEPGGEPALRKQVEDLAAELAVERQQAEAAAEAAVRDRRLLDHLVDIRSAEADDRGGWSTDAAYADAFREAGLDVAALTADEAAKRMRERSPAVATALASAVDDWAAIRRDRRKDRAGAAALAALARAADPDDWRNRLRTALDQPDTAARRTALQGLAGGASYETLGPVSLHLLGRALNDAADPAGAETVLRRAQRRYPGDVWINYGLAVALEKLARREEAIRYYTAARSLRPETAHELAHALQAKGEMEEAIGVFEDLRRLRPGNGRHLGCLGRALKNQGRTQEAGAILEAAAAANREAVRLRPDDAYAHFSLGFALDEQGKLDEAIAEYRTAIRIQPDYANAHDILGWALERQGKLDESIVEFRSAIRIHPDDADAHTNLGTRLYWQGKLDEAIAEYRAAIRVQPDHVKAHHGLGWALERQGKLDEAIAEYRTDIRIQPDYDWGHNSLAWATAKSPDCSSRERSEALEHARRAVALSPKEGTFHNTLALAEYRIGHWAESIAAAERSIALFKGVDASNWFFLAMALWQRGEKDRSCSYLDRAIAWTKKNDPKNAELLAFWREAAELLGQPGPSAAAPLPDLPAEPFAP